MSVEERDQSMEVFQLLDKLEALVSGGTRVPLTSKALIDEQEIIDVLDEIRGAFPEEIRQARRVSMEKEKVLHQAQAEADRLIAEAREEAARLVQDDELVRAARDQSESYVQDAIAQAEEVRIGADQYALDALAGLEDQLNRLLATVRRGRATLERSIRGAVGGADVEGEPSDSETVAAR
jgi:cell division septum initiation protein DivIVA